MAGCGNGDPTGPGGQLAFSRVITFAEFQQILSSGPQRLEIEIIPGTLTARELEVAQGEDLGDEEEIESPITDIDVADGTGTLTLALGGLQVGFSRAATEFEAEDSSEITFDEFVAQVQAALDDGRQPPVEAERNPPATPQDPADPTFFALKLELDDEADDPEIEINVDGDNLLMNADPPPDGWVHVLGLMIEIRASEGITELEAEEVQGEVEFEGIVASVEVGADGTGSVTLTDGTVVRVVEGTEIESDDGDEDELGSLAEVEAALAAGLTVEAEGEGVLESTGPTTIVAIEVEFEVED